MLVNIANRFHERKLKKQIFNTFVKRYFHKYSKQVPFTSFTSERNLAAAEKVLYAVNH